MGEASGAHGHRGGPVSVRGVRGTLEAAVVNRELRQLTGCLGGRDGLSHKVLKCLGHAYSFWDDASCAPMRATAA